jgi:hypothetical protein
MKCFLWKKRRRKIVDLRSIANLWKLPEKHRMELLSAYRTLCKLAKAIPSPAIRQQTLDEIRKLSREYYERNQLKEMKEFCDSKIFWLKCIVPKQLWPSNIVQSTPQGDTKTFVVRNGKLEETSRSSSYEYTSGTIDPDDLRRHQQLLRRMRFGKS